MTSVSTDRRLSVNAGAAVKVPVHAATTAAINIQAGGLLVIDGYQTVDGDRILVKNQVDATQNGIYVAHASAWTYDADWSASPYNAKKGTLVYVTDGATQSGFWYVSSSDPLTPGTSSFQFAQAALTGVPISIANGGTSATGTPAALDNLTTRGADIASAATINLDTATGDLVDVTGNIGITAITLGAGKWRTVRFTGTPTLTNGASLDLIGGANITMAAGDRATFRGYAGGVVRMMGFARAAGGEPATLTGTQTLTNKTLTNPANTVQVLADGVTVNWDASLGAYATLTTAAARTIAAPTNLKAGGHYVLLLTSGGFTPTWNAVFKPLNGGSMPAPGATGVTVYTFESDGTNLYLTAMPLFATLTNALGADVNLNNVANYFDGPIVTNLTVGVYVAIGTVTCSDTVAADFNVKLNDGTTTVASADSQSRAAGAAVSISVAGIFTNPAGNIRISVKDSTSVNGKIIFNNSGNSKDSHLVVIRIG